MEENNWSIYVKPFSKFHKASWSVSSYDLRIMNILQGIPIIQSAAFSLKMATSNSHGDCSGQLQYSSEQPCYVHGVNRYKFLPISNVRRTIYFLFNRCSGYRVGFFLENKNKKRKLVFDQTLSTHVILIMPTS